MMNEYERAMLAHYRIAFDKLAEETTHAIGPLFGERVRWISNQLNEIEAELRQEENERKLKGKGPLAELKFKLGIINVPTTNLLTKVPEADRASHDTALGLVKEFFNATQTGLGEGGSLSFDIETLPELPASIDKLSKGVYHNKTPTGKRLTVCLEVPGLNFCHVLITFPADKLHDRLSIKVNTYVEVEKEWVTHDFFEIMSRKALRAAMLDFAKRMGGVVSFVPRSEMIALGDEHLPKEDTGEGGYSAQVIFQGYRTRLWRVKDTGEVLLDIARQNGNMMTGFENLEWDDLTATKQQQLFDQLSDKLKGN